MKTRRKLITSGLTVWLGLSLAACGTETPGTTATSVPNQASSPAAAGTTNSNLVVVATTATNTGTTNAAAKAPATTVAKPNDPPKAAAPTSPPATVLKVTPLTSGEIEQINNATHTYLNNRAASFLKSTENFTKAVKTRDIGKAKAAYEIARMDYAALEFVMEEFEELGSAIDGHAEEFPQGDKDPNWRGYHALEKLLFVELKLNAQSDKLADQLLQDVTSLQTEIKTMELGPDFVLSELLNLLEENQFDKLPGEVEMYSHMELASLRGSLQTTRFVLDTLSPPLKSRNIAAGNDVRKSLDELDSMLNGLFRGTRAADYSKLDDLTRRQLAQRFEGLIEAFSKVGGLLGLEVD